MIYLSIIPALEGGIVALKNWQDLMTITRDAAFVIDRVRITDTDIAIEGPFGLSPLARLSIDDQAFVTAFVCCHGSIKKVEKYFGVSYPTIKNRLNTIGDQLEFGDIAPRATRSEILDRLDKGEITADEAIKLLKKGY